ncbi:MAG: leucine-rich repeat domain-containing protein, partial [Clostridia bacterium]|nr:leucine-rich repeat domain-containing protein [Clostridia bacterium]
MKRKVFSILLSALSVVALTFSLTACGEGNDDGDGAHTHVYNRQVSEQKYLKREATCTSRAEYYFSCECGERGENTFVYGDLGAHKLTHVETVPESCTENGTREYWICKDGCGVKFADENAEQMISDESSLTITAAHKLTHHEEVGATCDKEGMIEYWSCSGCNKNFADENAYETVTDLVIPATHVGWENNVCTGCGYNAGGTAGLEYSLYYGTETYAVSIGSVTAGEVVIPATYNGLPVSAVGSFTDSLITSVTIPNSVKTILFNAFSGCTELTKIVIPDSVESIYAQAFMGCTQLTDVKLSNALTSLGSSLFQGCTMLERIIIPEGVKRIQSAAFNGCSILSNVTLPNSLESIDKLVFLGCTALNKIVLPEGLTRIEELAFGDCPRLTRITIPASVTEIS